MTATSATSTSTTNGWLDEIVDRRGDLRAIAVMRMLFGVIVVRHLWPDLTASVVPVERFHVPWWSWLAVPSPAGYRALVMLGVVAGSVMAAAGFVSVSRRGVRAAAVGRIAWLATLVAFGVVTYLMLVDMTAFAHNRGFLVWLLFGLALMPLTSESNQLFWPATLLRVVISSVYLMSGGTKLLNPDWRSGLILWDRVVRFEHLIPFDGWVHDLLTSRAFHSVLSPIAIATELVIGAGLWFGRTRLVAVWVALLFHLSIEVAAEVQTFSYSAIAATLLWVTPSTRDRIVATRSARLASVVKRLDWLHRFELVRTTGATTTLTERDGTTSTGRDAELTTLSRLPLLFPVVAPALALHRLRRRAGTRHRPRQSAAC